MKKKQLIILIIILTISLISTFLYLKKTETDLEVKKKEILKDKYETLSIHNSFINYELTANGIIYELPVQNIKFETSGDLMQGEKLFIAGDEFQKNQLLFRINNTEAFNVLAEKKNNLALLLKNITTELETEIPLAKTKWVDFLNEIKPIKRLPELPNNFPPNERILLIKKGFIQEYVKTSMLEKEMEKYFYLAPFDGKYVRTIIEIGQKIEPGNTIAQIAEKSELLAKVTINKNDLKLYKNKKHVHFVTNKGRKIGNGEFLSLSKKKRKRKKFDTSNAMGIILYSISNPIPFISCQPDSLLSTI